MFKDFFFVNQKNRGRFCIKWIVFYIGVIDGGCSFQDFFNMGMLWVLVFNYLNVIYLLDMEYVG